MTRHILSAAQVLDTHDHLAGRPTPLGAALAACVPGDTLAVPVRPETVYHVEALFRLAEFRVLARPGFDLAKVDPESLQLPPGRAAALLQTALQTRLVPVSSTEIRALAAARKSLNGLVPDAVADYINQNHLYQG